MLQWQLSPPVQNLLTQYDLAIQRLASLIQPLAEATQLKLAGITGADPTLYPHWPHIFLILALQFLPRAEAFPGWDFASQNAFKMFAVTIGVILAFALATALGSFQWATNNTPLLFVLLAVTLCAFLQNCLADWTWPVFVDPEDDDPEPAPLPIRSGSDDTGHKLPSLPMFALAVCLVFAGLAVAVETSMSQEHSFAHSIVLVGYAACVGLGILLWIIVDSGDFGLLFSVLGLGSSPLSTPFTFASRVVLGLMIITLAIGSVGAIDEVPANDFMFHTGLVATVLTAVLAGQYIFFKYVPPDRAQRNYPFPSALGIFLLGASLLFVLNLILAH
ncbi:MAG: hypothetical protein ABL973_19285 [Micropepsaceae bacterium]